MKRILPAISFITCLIPVILSAQKIITLKECYEGAMVRTALAGEKEAYYSIWQLNDKNLSKNWLPSLDANASAVYNSEVIDVGGIFSSLPIPGLAGAIKPLPHEQYKVTLDVNQVIYDGGAVRKSKVVEKADMNVSQQQTESDLYKLRDQINNCYFSILNNEKQKELLNDYLELINKRLKSMEAAQVNGVILKSDIDVITSEKIRTEQQISENEIIRISLLKVLTDLTGIQAGNETSLILPQVKGELNYDISRPELKVYDLKKDQLEAGLGVLGTKRMPKAFGFATFGYGNPPGSNFFRNEFATYYVVGGGVKWNIIDWNTVKNQKQQIKLQQEILDKRKEDLTDNLKRTLELKSAEITSLTLLIEKDAELINLRKRITASASSQYENGKITATDLLSELNSEQQALKNLEIHKISRVLAIIEFLNISGKDIDR